METKKWYQSRTIWYAVATGVAGLIAAIHAQYPDLAVAASVNTVIAIILRMMSSSEIE